jgi:aspartyl aminopeptidase
MATVEELKKELFYKPQHASAVVEENEVAKADAFAEEYKKFLDNAKTEREAVAVVLEDAKKNGFQDFDPDKQYKAGDKIYYVNREK